MRWGLVGVCGIVLGVALNSLVFYPPVVEELTESVPQTRLAESSKPVFRADGSLALSGYSLQPAGAFNDTVLQQSWLYKRWDFFSLFHPDLIVAFCIADLSYVGCM